MKSKYKKLLSFLEDQESRNIQVSDKNPSIINKAIKKKKSSINVEEFIEDSTLYSYIPPSEKHNLFSSKGFDVKKFESIMRSKLIDGYKRGQNYKKPYVSVSELYSCLRKSFYTRSKYPIDLSQEFNFSYLHLINKIGNVVHDVIQDLYNFKELEKTIISEIYKVKGRLDAVDEKFLYEIKTIDKDKFQNKYIEAHFLQANIYAYMLNNEYDGYNINEVVLIYVLRNLKRIIPFDLMIDNKLAESHLKRAPILLSSVEQKIAPDPIGATKEQCQYCSYKKYCNDDHCIKVFQPFKQKVVKKEKPVFLL